MLYRYELGDSMLVNFLNIAIVMQGLPGLTVTYAGPVVGGPGLFSVMGSGST